jgi:hypothetical protein
VMRLVTNSNPAIGPMTPGWCRAWIWG